MTLIAFVVPWFGERVAEEVGRQVATLAAGLARRGHAVEVLTTCSAARREDVEDDGFPEGTCEENGVVVHRFPVRPRNAAAFRRALEDLRALDGRKKPIGISPVPESTARAFFAQDVQAPGLLEHLVRERHRYDVVVFAPYSSALTLEGMASVRDRAVLHPALRDETVAWLPGVERAFLGARRILFGSEEEAQLAARLFGPPAARRAFVFAGEAADPGAVLDRYEESLRLPAREVRRPQSRRGLRAIHQLLPSIDYGDAISNQTVFTREVLHDLGYESEIFVLDVGASMRDFARRFEPGHILPTDGLLYHHAIGTSLTAHAIAHPGPKALQYHNITPGHFFDRWDKKFAEILEMGRKDLPHLAAAFPVSAGDSTYNADELRQAGFKDPMVVPIFVDPMRWALPADPAWMEILQDGRTNLLFVGRVAPNKCQHHLVEAFRQYLRHDPGARLLLVGVWPDGHPYVRFIREEAERLGIGAQVVLASRATDAQLLACYRTAHLFWSMSEHEGFCVPAIEAMWFDVPVLAYKSSAVPETLGEAGILFSEKRWPELAALAHMLVEDQSLRRTVLAAQRRRRSAFLPEAVLPALREMLARLDAEERNAASGGDQRPRAETTSKYPSMMRGQR